MFTENFTANVQYNDLLGTVAADHSDNESLSSWMNEQGYIDEDDLVLGVELYTSDGFLDDDEPLGITVYVGNHVDDSIKQVKMNMSMNSFLSCFKRLHIMLSRDGDLNGRSLKIDEVIDLNDQ